MTVNTVSGDLTALEKANVELVDRFIDSFFDPATVRYDDIAPDGAVRTAEFLPPAIGPDGLREMFRQYQKPTDRTTVVTHKTFAHGRMVVNVRTDVVKSEGQPDKAYEIVGVFLVKDGKIKEWCDYIESGV